MLKTLAFLCLSFKCVPLNQLRSGEQRHYLIQNTAPKERTPFQSAQVKRNGPTIQLQYLDGNSDQHRLCFFLNQESKNACCASSNQLAKAATFLRAFYSLGELLILMHYKGSKKKKKNSSHICTWFISRPCGSHCSNWKK